MRRRLQRRQLPRVERIGERRRGVQGIREQRVEIGAGRIEVPARGRHLVLRLRECEARLQRFEPRRGAGLEPVLRGIPRARLDGFELLRVRHAAGRAHRLVIRAAHVGADVRGNARGVRFRDRKDRVGEVDAPLALARQVQRHRPHEGPMRRFFRVLETDVGVRPLSGGLDAGDVDRARRAGGEDGAIGLEGARHRVVQGEGRRSLPDG